MKVIVVGDIILDVNYNSQFQIKITLLKEKQQKIKKEM